MNRSERQRRHFKEYKERQLKNPKFREAFEEGLDWLTLAASAASMRERMHLSQTELAARIHSSQAVISRLERGGNVQIETLNRIAKALNAKLKIDFIPQRG